MWGGLAIVGSRDVDKEGEDFTGKVARVCAQNNMPVVSGGARGVDSIAMKNALDAGGIVIGVLASDLLRAIVKPEFLNAINQNRLLLISPYHPKAGFSIGNAMGRNSLIYAMADFGLVISSSYKKGGTWNGAINELKRSTDKKLFVKSGPGAPKGNEELIKLGALPWPENVDYDNLKNELIRLTNEPVEETKPREEKKIPRTRHPMNQKPKLELTWIGKEQQPRLEPRILIEDSDKSYGDKNTENMLIHGDNLLALKALEQDFAGKIKCIYIDPPYNTGNAFEHYDDGVEHSIWLSLMKPRLEMLRTLLRDDGSLWISIDDDECHYLKVLCDEIFGRSNFIANVIWQKKYAPANDSKWLSDDHDHIIVYAKNKPIWRPYKLPRTEEQDKLYTNPDNDPRGPWMSDNYTCAKSSDERPNLYYPIINPNTKKEILPKKTRVWAFSQEAHQRHVRENLMYWGKNGKNSTPRLKKFRKNLRDKGRVSSTIWSYSEVGHTQDARREILALNSENPFSTPKPESLLLRILKLSTLPGDFVLDSFLGSGTTAAVAHKMGRKWIGIELGDHCYTHCIPRLKKVVDGVDQGGISKEVNWKGGGGFRFYELAPSLLKKDSYGNWVIEEQYNPDMLAAAMAKHEGFRYCPHEEIYWKQGFSTEKDFIFTTTAFLTLEHLDRIHEEMKDDESLLIACKSFSDGCRGKYENITIKKIPQMLLGRCEFGKEDYSLNIVNLPGNNDDQEYVPPGPPDKARKKKEKKEPEGQLTMFEGGGN